MRVSNGFLGSGYESPSCISCGKEISEEEAETYCEMCRECYETEIIELDLESDEA